MATAWLQQLKRELDEDHPDPRGIHNYYQELENLRIEIKKMKKGKARKSSPDTLSCPEKP